MFSVAVLAVLLALQCACVSQLDGMEDIVRSYIGNTDDTAANEEDTDTSPTNDGEDKSQWESAGVTKYTPAASHREGETSLAGYMDGYSYINEFFGIACVLDEDWEITSENELLLENGLSEAIPDAELAEYLQTCGTNNGNYIVMQASKNAGTNEIFMYVTWEPGLPDDPEKLVDGILLYKDEMEGAIAEDKDDIGDVSMTLEKNFISFRGEETPGLRVDITVWDDDSQSGIHIIEENLFLKNGEYVLVVQLTSAFGDSGVAGLAEYFSPTAAALGQKIDMDE